MNQRWERVRREVVREWRTNGEGLRRQRDKVNSGKEEEKRE